MFSFIKKKRSLSSMEGALVVFYWSKGIRWILLKKSLLLSYGSKSLFVIFNERCFFSMEQEAIAVFARRLRCIFRILWEKTSSCSMEEPVKFFFPKDEDLVNYYRIRPTDLLLVFYGRKKKCWSSKANYHSIFKKKSFCFSRCSKKHFDF